MKKYGDVEKLDVVRGKEAAVLADHLSRTGKTVSDFSKEEKEALRDELTEARAEEEEAARMEGEGGPAGPSEDA